MNIKIPDWLNDICKSRIFKNDKEKMEFVINLAEKSIENGGGPFGAAIFSMDDSSLTSCGVNLVVINNLSILHAEIVAFMLAQSKLNSYDLSSIGSFELFSSSEPCAMCLGAALWSGVRRVVFGASSKYARNIGFDEGPVFEESWKYLENRGIKIKKEFLSEKAEFLFKRYTEKHGIIYNSRLINEKLINKK